MGGFMCFSWPDFEAGNANPIDKVNLGLHEFGHALRFNGIKGAETDYFFENYFPRWVGTASKDFTKMRNRIPTIFRKYGAVNINEFFSVVVETFFESPNEFKSFSPELFSQTAILLNQYIDENGNVKLNCRQELLDQTKVELNNNYSKNIMFGLGWSGSLIMTIVFLLVEYLILKNTEDFSDPSTYFCLIIAFLFWLNLEKNHTKVIFEKDHFIMEKGVLLLKGYTRQKLPMAQLISIIVNYEYYTNNIGITKKYLNTIRLKYYHNNSFHEKILHCHVTQPDFDLLCDDLKENGIHVFFKGN